MGARGPRNSKEMRDKLAAAQPPRRHETPPPPEHLELAGVRLWEAVVADYALERADLELLALASEAADRLAQAREILKREGVVIEGKMGMRPHPAIAIERDARMAVSRLMRQLGLEA
jgi:P27 family predicted phage terminase small subunit